MIRSATYSLKKGIRFRHAWKRDLFFTASWLGFLSLLAFAFGAAVDLPEPGPENAGMRLRFIVSPEKKGTNEAFQVRLDLINVTDKPIQLMCDWPSDRDMGDYKEYLEADVSILTEPPIIPLMAQVMATERNYLQPKYTLGARETLTLEWKSSGRRLKSKWIHHLSTRNPYFPTDGLYSVRAEVSLCLANNEQRHQAPPKTNEHARFLADWPKSFEDSRPHGTIQLVSNKQPVPIGGSHETPKSSLGKIVSVNRNELTAEIDLGLGQKVKPGDQFDIHTGYTRHRWKLRITDVDWTSSSGTLEPIITQHGTNVFVPNIKLLVRGSLAELITKDNPR